GDKLYVLSRYAGLAVVEVGAHDRLTLLGARQVSGQPFEMVLRGTIAYAMFTAWGRYAFDGGAGRPTWVESSRVEALDVSDSSHTRSVGSFDVPGTLSDSRVVGDVLYVVSHEDGFCWKCDKAAETAVTSLAIADPNAIHVVDRLTYPDASGFSRSVMA